MDNSIENWTQATKRFGENAGDILNKTVVETDALKAKTEQFEQSLKNLKIPTINTENISVLQRELAKAEAEVEKLRAKLANGITMGRISANVDDKGFRNLQEQIALAEKKAEALRQKIKEVGDAGGKENVEKLGKGISGLSENGKKAGNALNKVSNSILNLSSRASGALSPINKMSSSFKSLIKTILPILGIRQLFNWGKQSTEIASDLTEVQNVVDATFGNMSYKMKPIASRKTYIKNLREQRKGNGLCIWCGKPICSTSTVFCIDCKIKNKRNNNKRKSWIERSERHEYGLCYICGKRAVDVEKLCEDCYKRSCKNLPQSKDGANYRNWKLGNELIFGNGGRK